MNQTVRKGLIIFMRYPEPGRVKSRLAKSIGEERAARVYDKLLRRNLGIVSEYKRLHPSVEVFISFSPEEKGEQIEKSYPGPWRFIPQEGVDLGLRMEQAISRVMEEGCRHVLLVGTDLADIKTSDFEDAFDALKKSDAVLGPAADGGFYLIGLTRPCPAVFRSREWGTADVYRKSEQLLRESGFGVHRIATRRDVDRPEDLKILSENAMFQDSLSVIIPTLALSERLDHLLASINAQLWPDDEIVVVKGGRHTYEDKGQIDDNTRLILSPKGRGVQLNSGARAASGSIFLFLHEDSLPPPNFSYLVRQISVTDNSSLGCFQLGFSPSSSSLDMIADWANIRTRIFKLPYGDQGLFCRRSTFFQAGGFKRQYLMEDVDFVRHCRKLGSLLVLPQKLYTSPRRYLKKGVLRACIENHILTILYRIGVDDRKLYSIYYRT
jgi:uncharacterized protein